MPQSKSIQRSTLELKKRGYRVAITERWNQFAHVRQDLFGFIDILAIKADEQGVLAVQACTIGTGSGGGDLAGHIKKLTVYDPTDKNSANRIDAVKIWLKSGNRIQIWGWGKRGEKDKRKLWILKVVEVTLPPINPGRIELDVPVHVNGESLYESF